MISAYMYLVENRPVVLKKKMSKCVNVFLLFLILPTFGKGRGPSFAQIELILPEDALC